MTESFALIICTYMRPSALQKLLFSVRDQTLYPDEILIIDGSINSETEKIFQTNTHKNLNYYKVEQQHRGLTRQRNYGINKVGSNISIICFLDDDVVLDKDYFKTLLSTFKLKPGALGVGGYIANASNWKESDAKCHSKKFYFDNWMRDEPVRFRLRKKIGLAPDTPPGFLPTFAHGRSIGFLPPSGKIYEVEQLMGGVSSYRKEIFNTFQFSTYFEGYGLYEDTDFSIRVSKQGKLYVNTNAQLNHYHEPLGRPNHFKYGKMVLRNGWYVWRVKHPQPKLLALLKWNATAWLLILIRLSNCFTMKNNGAFYESLGRIVGWCSLVFTKPKVD
ncbi:glycosyltransferase family 2 protein [Hyunsoonleella pacifica]|uniref:Glycosyltransferase n=1 Tax=Hyunsoonleella pacifica TaxID=1080224 RepID=A0A4Q9FR92_9FLAO|nr:glycosyltransferase [Hyunsoonleella pacifica]TBN18524.1 glycosyltransferase [Hyunsoonleella pacifica]GGD02518.1 glycosyl transferase family 2 [Hyunsoonleella pacifica]